METPPPQPAVPTLGTLNYQSPPSIRKFVPFQNRYLRLLDRHLPWLCLAAAILIFLYRIFPHLGYSRLPVPLPHLSPYTTHWLYIVLPNLAEFFWTAAVIAPAMLLSAKTIAKWFRFALPTSLWLRMFACYFLAQQFAGLAALVAAPVFVKAVLSLPHYIQFDDVYPPNSVAYLCFLQLVHALAFLLALYYLARLALRLTRKDARRILVFWTFLLLLQWTLWAVLTVVLSVILNCLHIYL